MSASWSVTSGGKARTARGLIGTAEAVPSYRAINFVVLVESL